MSNEEYWSDDENESNIAQQPERLLPSSESEIDSEEEEYYKLIRNKIINKEPFNVSFTKKDDESMKGCSFYTSWITYKFNLPKDILFI